MGLHTLGVDFHGCCSHVIILVPLVPIPYRNCNLERLVHLLQPTKINKNYFRNL